MSSGFRIGMLGLSLAAGALLAGCQSSGNHNDAASTHAMSADAVQCDKCQTTWVNQPVEGGKGHVMGYTSRKQMECPDCRSAVDNFFATGKLQHECKTCGGNMTICEGH